MDNRPVVVYQGKNEYDAQVARTVLQAAGIPDLHIPSLTAGIFGVQTRTNVAVPAELAARAREVLEENGIAPVPLHETATPPGLDAFPSRGSQGYGAPNLPENSRLRWVLIVVGGAIALLVYLQLAKNG